MKVSEKILRNTVFNTIGHIWSLLISLLLVPFVIKKIGIERYGIWVAIGVGLSYFTLLDIPGIGSAFTKYIAEFYAKKKYSLINQILKLGFLYYTIFNLLITIFVLIFKGQLIKFLKFRGNLLNEALFVITGVLIVNFIRGSFIVFRSLLLGLQRMDLTNLIVIITSTLNLIGTIILLNLGFGLKGLVYISIIIAIVTVVLQVIFSYRVFSQIKFIPFSIDKDILKKTVSYGIKIQIAKFSEMINQGIDKLLLGHFLGVRYTGFYEVGAKISNLTSSFPNLLLPAITPASSELDALNEKEKIKKLYERGTKYLVLLTIPLTFFIFGNASEIVFVWIGKNYKYSVLALKLLVLAYNIYILNGMGRLIARGIGKPGIEMKTCIFVAVSNIILSYSLIIKLGFIGALIGTTVSSFFGTIYFLFNFHKSLNLDFISIFKKIYRIPLLFSIFFVYLISLIKVDNLERIEVFGILIVKALICFLLYTLFLFRMNYFDRFDKEVIKSLIKKNLRK